MPSIKLIKNALHEFVKQLYEVEKDNLIQVTVFGSVARGENRKDSDIDVFVLVGRQDDLYKARGRVANIAFEVNTMMENKVYISPLILSKDLFEQNKKKDLIFYNIKNDGVVLYDAES